jgi:hypothetical protein
MATSANTYSAIKKIVHATVVLAFVAAPTLGNAQRGPSGDMPRFIEMGPKVGEQLPDLTIVNDLGQPVNIREITKGNYSVLVLGCLT